MISFFLDCVPPTTTAQQKGVSRGRFFTKAKVKDAERLYCTLLVPHRPKAPLTGPLSAEITFTFPFRNGESKSVIAQGWMPHDKRPDCSNLVKLFEDCMGIVGFFGDDGQIADLRVRKGWGKKPGIGVTIVAFTHFEP